MDQADNGPAISAAKAPQREPPRLVKAWPALRTGVQLLGLLAEKHEGLHLAAQALAMAGDLAVTLYKKIR